MEIGRNCSLVVKHLETLGILGEVLSDVRQAEIEPEHHLPQTDANCRKEVRV